MASCIVGSGPLAEALERALPGAMRLEDDLARFAPAFAESLPASIDALFLLPPQPGPATLARFEVFRADFERGLYTTLAALAACLPRLAPRARITLVAPPPGEPLAAAGPLAAALATLTQVLRSELDTSVRCIPLPADRADAAERLARDERSADGELARRLERLAPGRADRRAGLERASVRRAGYRAHSPRSALVTGASSGLGRELARLIAPRLDRLVLVARRTDALAALQRELSLRSSARIEACALDLRDAAAVERFADVLGPVELLVQCAGVHAIRSLSETSMASYRELCETNFLGPARIAASALARTPPARQLVHVISTSAIAGRRGRAAYALAKAALWALTRELRRVHGAGTQILEVLPSTFDSRPPGDASRRDPARARSTRTLRADRVAERVDAALRAGRDRAYVPGEVRAYLWLEALAPALFRRIFP